MKAKLWLPLIGYVVPTLGIGFGVVIPGSCIAGINEHTLGFLGAVAGAGATYVIGVLAAQREYGGHAQKIPWFWRHIGEQARRPSGRLGQLLFAIMAWETRRENQEAIRRLELAPGHSVLEVGFGHGRTLGALLQLVPQGLVVGVDWSDDAVSQAASRFT